MSSSSEFSLSFTSDNQPIRARSRILGSRPCPCPCPTLCAEEPRETPPRRRARARARGRCPFREYRDRPSSPLINSRRPRAAASARAALRSSGACSPTKIGSAGSSDRALPDAARTTRGLGPFINRLLALSRSSHSWLADSELHCSRQRRSRHRSPPISVERVMSRSRRIEPSLGRQRAIRLRRPLRQSP